MTYRSLVLGLVAFALCGLPRMTEAQPNPPAFLDRTDAAKTAAGLKSLQVKLFQAQRVRNPAVQRDEIAAVTKELQGFVGHEVEWKFSLCFRNDVGSFPLTHNDAGPDAVVALTGYSNVVDTRLDAQNRVVTETGNVSIVLAAGADLYAARVASRRFDAVERSHARLTVGNGISPEDFKAIKGYEAVPCKGTIHSVRVNGWSIELVLDGRIQSLPSGKAVEHVYHAPGENGWYPYHGSLRTKDGMTESLELILSKKNGDWRAMIDRNSAKNIDNLVGGYGVENGLCVVTADNSAENAIRKRVEDKFNPVVTYQQTMTMKGKFRDGYIFEGDFVRKCERPDKKNETTEGTFKLFLETNR